MNCGATANAARRRKLPLYGKVPWFHALAIKIPIGPGTDSVLPDCTICKRGLGAPMTISIIDDDQVVREATGDLVESLGYEVATFESAERFRAVPGIWAPRGDLVPDHRFTNAWPLRP